MMMMTMPMPSPSSDDDLATTNSYQHPQLCMTVKIISLEAIPIYVEELLLQLTCWVECTT